MQVLMNRSLSQRMCPFYSRLNRTSENSWIVSRAFVSPSSWPFFCVRASPGRLKENAGKPQRHYQTFLVPSKRALLVPVFCLWVSAPLCLFNSPPFFTFIPGLSGMFILYKRSYNVRSSGLRRIWTILWWRVPNVSWFCAGQWSLDCSQWWLSEFLDVIMRLFISMECRRTRPLKWNDGGEKNSHYSDLARLNVSIPRGSLRSDFVRIATRVDTNSLFCVFWL